MFCRIETECSCPHSDPANHNSDKNRPGTAALLTIIRTRTQDVIFPFFTVKNRTGTFDLSLHR